MENTQQQSLRIALMNSTDFAGGAESVVRMLRDGLHQRGHQVELWVGRSNGGSGETTRVIPRTADQKIRADRFARKGFFSLGLDGSTDFCYSPALASFDLVHLHNLHGHYFSIDALPHLCGRLPLVWTFHDFFPITGGCAFPFECDRWLSRCGACPQLGNYPIVSVLDRTRRMQSIKRKVFRELPVTIVTPSQHLGCAVKKSGVFEAAEFETIPYGVDTKVFHPHRESARRQLGLPLDKPVVLLAAQGLDDPRKGVEHAIIALTQLKDLEPIVLLVGSGDTNTLLERLPHHDVRPQGYVTETDSIARCYAAADIFVFTSLAENYPCSVQESMACGTAVLAFDIDGVNEQITPDKTGFLVPAADTDALRNAIQQLLCNPEKLKRVGIEARRHAEANWSLQTFLDRHEQLYRKVLDSMTTKAKKSTFAQTVS